MTSLPELTTSVAPASNTRHQFTAYGRTHTIQVGSYIKPEGWRLGNLLTPSDWDGAEFRIESPNYPGVTRAVNVTVTGRTFQGLPHSDARWVKVRIEFVGDGEPSTSAKGWWMVDPRG
jgi:hypothetical protein